MQLKPIKLWPSYLQRFKVKLNLWQISVMAFLSLPSLAMAAPNDAEALQGHWRLEQAGTIESGQLKAYDFNSCRLLRTYSLRADGHAIYSSVEGEEGACIPLEPRLSYWRLDGQRLVFYTAEEVLESGTVVWIDAKHIRFESDVDLRQDANEGQDTRLPMPLKTYQILRRED